VCDTYCAADKSDSRKRAIKILVVIGIAAVWWPVEMIFYLAQFRTNSRRAVKRLCMCVCAWFPRYYYFCSVHDCLWPWKVLQFKQYSWSYKPHASSEFWFMCKHIVVNMHYISGVIGIKTLVSNNKSDLRGNLRSLIFAPFHRPHTISY